MASPHAAADMLQSGGGDLTPSLFPQLDDDALTTYLQAKLATGYVRASAITPALSAADLDAAAIAWAYYTAYLAIWQRLSASPADAEVTGEAKQTYLASQIQTFKDLADLYLARHEQFIAVAAGNASGNVIVTSVPNHLRY